MLSSKPFIVASRNSEKLVKRLAQDNYPILLEGVHSCSIMDNPQLKGRKFLIRNHNIEHDYYRHLASSEKKIFKKWFFKREAAKLLTYEKKVFPLAFEILGISKKDTTYLQNKYKKGTLVSAFHQFDDLSFSDKNEHFAFYHGNLSVSENDLAAIYLVKKVFSKIVYPLVIAGKSPSKKLIELCEGKSNITLKADISSDEIMELLEKAHINVLPTFQNTGIKLKLLAALFAGKHCLVNSPMVKETGLEELCDIQDEATKFAETVTKLAEQPFTLTQFQARKQLLSRFRNDRGVETFEKLLQ
jgi:glycosyltransferase involved in cell wall biosynthesis